VPLFAPAGAIAAAALLGYGWRPARAAAGATLACAATFAAGELARATAGGDVRPRAFALRVAAAALGAVAVAVARRPRPVTADRRGPPGTRPGTPLRAAAAAVLLLALWYWRPFALHAGLRPELTIDSLVPLRALRELFTIYSVADVGVDFLLFFPLGVWLVVYPLRRGGAVGGALRGVLPALWLAALLEAGQLWVRGRTFDVTDLLVQWAGVLVGAAVVTQARLRVLRERRRGTPAAVPGAA
jgi:VanZ family protein